MTENEAVQKTIDWLLNPRTLGNILEAEKAKKERFGMETLKLSKSFKANGEEITEINYDLENMTARDKLAAGKLMRKSGTGFTTVEEIDPEYHFYLFAAAVEKAYSNSENKISAEDLLNMNARDMAKACDTVRNFFYLSSGE